MNEKIRWLRNKIKSIDLDAMIVSNPINIKYLTGIEAEGILILIGLDTIIASKSMLLILFLNHLIFSFIKDYRLSFI